MESMFDYCSQLTNLDLSHFNTENVTNMSHMFEECPSLVYLNLSNFNLKNVTNMIEMFNGINRNCEIICDDQKLKKEIMNI
jgi:surface protein